MKYKLDILRACGNKNYTLKALKPLVGPNEISRFIKKYDKHSEIYSADDENFKNAIYKANLHIHTINSDGVLDVKEVMRQAQDYGEMLPDGEYMYVCCNY
ncbi:hypothetical protein IJV79_00365 [bacterium]|nr:hypothetical protein [bacterium]